MSLYGVSFGLDVCAVREPLRHATSAGREAAVAGQTRSSSHTSTAGSGNCGVDEAGSNSKHSVGVSISLAGLTLCCLRVVGCAFHE